MIESREKSGMLNKRANQNGRLETKTSNHVQRIPSEPIQIEYNLGTSPRLLIGAIDMLNLQANCKILGIKSLRDNTLYTDQTLFCDSPARLVKCVNIVNS